MQLMHDRVKKRQQTHLPPLHNPVEHMTGPDDAKQADLVPDLPLSGGKENVVTAMDVFSWFCFAYPTPS